MGMDSMDSFYRENISKYWEEYGLDALNKVFEAYIDQQWQKEMDEWLDQARDELGGS